MDNERKKVLVRSSSSRWKSENIMCVEKVIERVGEMGEMGELVFVLRDLCFFF